MQETTFRDVLQQAMAGQEPPISQGIVGGAVRAAHAARRRRLAGGVLAVAAVVPGLTFGMPVIAGALSPGTQARHAGVRPLAAGHLATKKAPAHASHQAAGPGLTFTFVRPRLPATIPEVSPVPITMQSLGQLLTDDMPAGVQTSKLQAGIRLPGSQPGQTPATLESAETWFNEVTTPIGSGTVQVSMVSAGPTPSDIGCHGMPPSDPCRVYSLPGGTQVQEEDMGGLWFVFVFRPSATYVSVSEDNRAMAAGSPATKGIPLTMKQLLKIALDPRWGFTISQSFAQAASHLHVAPLDTSGS